MVKGEDVLKERGIGEVFLDVKVDIIFSILGEETFWKFTEVDSVSAVLRSDVISMVLVGCVTEWSAISVSKVANVDAVWFVGNTEYTGVTVELSTVSGGKVDAVPM